MKKCILLLLFAVAAVFAANALHAPAEEPPEAFVITPGFEDNVAGSGAGYYFFDTTEPSDPIFRYWWFHQWGSQGWADNDAYWTTTIPFDVRFCGVDYPAGSPLYVGSNGMVGFTEAGMDEPINQELPDSAAPNAIIAGWWDDLDGSSGGNIWLDLDSHDGVQALAITYQPQYFADSAPSDPIKFQIQIYEQEYPGTNNRIEVQYFDVIGDSWRDSGASATIGLENQGGTEAALYSFEQAVLSDVFGIRFVDQLLYDSRIGPFDLLAPPDGTEITIGDRVTFRWGEPAYEGEGDLTYYMLFADNPELTDPYELNVGSSTHKDIVFGTIGLDPGIWYWSVRCEESLLGNTRMADSVRSFTLIEELDSTPPQVSGQSPPHGQTEVPSDVNISFHATDDMSGVDTSTIVFTCHDSSPSAGGAVLRAGGSNTLISGTLTINDADPLDVICTFDPDQLLPPDTITCTVSAGLADTAGNATDRNIIWSFKVHGAGVENTTWGALKAQF
ncbi:MAG TPA: Ig-like domain-containing protein [bacterium]|nr:Ig-like domain-containing protein [bacterium]